MKLTIGRQLDILLKACSVPYCCKSLTHTDSVEQEDHAKRETG